jgi:replication factor A1
MDIGDKNAERMKIEDLKTYSRNVETVVKVVSKTEPREVSSRRDLSTHRVAEALIGDETGSIYLTLWDQDIKEVEEGQVLKIKNAYVKLFRGSMRLNIGRLGSYEQAEEAPFDDVNLDNNLSNKQYERSYSRPFGGRRYSDRSRRRY